MYFQFLGFCTSGASAMYGNPVNISEYKHVAQLINKTDKSHICGGSLLSKNHILTAKVCIENASKSDPDIEVVLGSHYLEGFRGIVHSIKSFKEIRNIIIITVIKTSYSVCLC